MSFQTDTIELQASAFTAKNLPDFNFNHIQNLTDDTGMLQHALFDLPNRKEGYCIDDNARALLLMVWAGAYKSVETPRRLLPIYLSYIHYMQTKDGFFRNFMNYDKHIEEDRGSEDSFGRTIMALGFLVNDSKSTNLVRTGADLFNKAYPHIKHLRSLRGMANAVVGLCQYVKYNYPDDQKVALICQLADKLTGAYEDHQAADWHWFEPTLTYDNAILPLALLNAYEITQYEVYKEVAFESMEFLESIVVRDGVLSPVGNQGWCSRDKEAARFDQQGIDVMAMVLFYQQAFRLTREKSFLHAMYNSYQWFLGRNDLATPLYDPTTGGCADGLHSEGVNLNQGAESTLAYWISHVVVERALAE
ncbi:glycosyltransferase [Paraflavitalea pollutisoli]|uniref:glycosyltransferase n=1 Tax=Paraflavitalea pollutisoli TaxID=3034143 RepID=UPI0023EC1476|nr:glycosyltransferase [Paraflavitalea sp. H1-2-19X]